MASIPPVSTVLILFCICAEIIRELCFKRAADGKAVLDSLLQPMTIMGIIIWVIETIVWLLVLERVPLSIAYTMMSLVYIVILFGGAVLLNEKISPKRMVGAALIGLGVAMTGSVG